MGAESERQFAGGNDGYNVAPVYKLAEAVSAKSEPVWHSGSELGCCVSRGGRPGLPVPNSPYGLCGRKATLN